MNSIKLSIIWFDIFHFVPSAYFKTFHEHKKERHGLNIRLSFLHNFTNFYHKRLANKNNFVILSILLGLKCLHRKRILRLVTIIYSIRLSP